MKAVAKNRWWGSGALLAAAALGAAAAQRFSASVSWGILWALVLAIPSFWALSATLWQSNQRFLAAFAGGMLFRLAGLAGGIAFFWRRGTPFIMGFALAASLALAVLAWIEMVFIARQNRMHQ